MYSICTVVLTEYTYMYMYMYNNHVFVQVCMYMYTCTCIHIHVYIHVHVHVFGTYPYKFICRINPATSTCTMYSTLKLSRGEWVRLYMYKTYMYSVRTNAHKRLPTCMYMYMYMYM